jgi:hypothetical protein
MVILVKNLLMRRLFFALALGFGRMVGHSEVIQAAALAGAVSWSERRVERISIPHWRLKHSSLHSRAHVCIAENL